VPCATPYCCVSVFTEGTRAVIFPVVIWPRKMAASYLGTFAGDELVNIPYTYTVG
jgi:hypothetical protein